jgi:hypothetical protein
LGHNKQNNQDAARSNSARTDEAQEKERSTMKEMDMLNTSVNLRGGVILLSSHFFAIIPLLTFITYLSVCCQGSEKGLIILKSLTSNLKISGPKNGKLWAIHSDK